MEDVIELRDPTISPDGIAVNDVIKFFKGDGPAAQLEAGQQKGGEYFCWCCSLSSHRSNDIQHSFYQPSMSLEERRLKVLESLRSTNRSYRKDTKLYKDLSKTELVSELHERGVKFR